MSCNVVVFITIREKIQEDNITLKELEDMHGKYMKRQEVCIDRFYIFIELTLNCMILVFVACE